MLFLWNMDIPQFRVTSWHFWMPTNWIIGTSVTHAVGHHQTEPLIFIVHGLCSGWWHCRFLFLKISQKLDSLLRSNHEWSGTLILHFSWQMQQQKFQQTAQWLEAWMPGNAAKKRHGIGLQSGKNAIHWAMPWVQLSLSFPWADGMCILVQENQQAWLAFCGTFLMAILKNTTELLTTLAKGL